MQFLYIILAMSTTIELYIVLLIDLFLAILLGIIPVLRGREAFFGVRISRQYYRETAKPIIFRKWLIFIAISFAVALYYLFVGSDRRELAISLHLFIPALFALALWIYWHRMVKPNEELPEIDLTSLNPPKRRLIDYLHPPIEVLCLTCIIASVLYGVVHYPQMSQRIAVHFDAAGAPDGYSQKNIFSVFSISIVNLGVYLLMLIAGLAIVHSKATMPKEHLKEYLLLVDKKIRLNMNFLTAMRLVMVMIFAYMQTIVVRAALDAPSGEPGLMLMTIGTVPLVIIATVIYMRRYKGINDCIVNLLGTVDPGYSKDSEGWKWGIIYYNPKDPAIFVEKLVGYGYTLNFGNKKSWWITIGFLAFMGLIIATSFLIPLLLK